MRTGQAASRWVGVILTIQECCHPEPPEASEPKAQRRRTAKDLKMRNSG